MAIIYCVIMVDTPLVEVVVAPRAAIGQSIDNIMQFSSMALIYCGNNY